MLLSAESIALAQAPDVDPNDVSLFLHQNSARYDLNAQQQREQRAQKMLECFQAEGNSRVMEVCVYGFNAYGYQGMSLRDGTKITPNTMAVGSRFFPLGSTLILEDPHGMPRMKVRVIDTTNEHLVVSHAIAMQFHDTRQSVKKLLLRVTYIAPGSEQESPAWEPSLW